MATAPVWSERRLLAIALRAMMAVAVLAALVLSWRYAAGPADPEGPPSVRVVKLLPGTFLWADAPADARYLPDGLRAQEAARLKLMLLRGEDGAVRTGCGESRRRLLQGTTDLEERTDVVAVDVGDHGDPGGLLRDQAVCDEPAERLAQRGAAHAEPSGLLDLHQHGTGGERTGLDLVPQRAVRVLTGSHGPPFGRPR